MFKKLMYLPNYPNHLTSVPLYLYENISGYIFTLFVLMIELILHHGRTKMIHQVFFVKLRSENDHDPLLGIGH